MKEYISEDIVECTICGEYPHKSISSNLPKGLSIRICCHCGITTHIHASMALAIQEWNSINQIVKQDSGGFLSDSWLNKADIESKERKLDAD